MRNTNDVRPRPLMGALLVLILSLVALLSGLFPFTVILGLATGGVLDSGQVQPVRWWLGAVLALILFALLSWRWLFRARIWWAAILVGAIASGIAAFAFIASHGQGEGGRSKATTPPVLTNPLRVGVVTALPLFWAEGADISELLSDGVEPVPAAVTRHEVHAVDHIDAQALAALDSVFVAQPRLLQPEELVALDGWIRAGGKAVILADPLLHWHSDFPIGDPRRPPLTSLLDPLLTHWGVRLEPANANGPAVERRMLGSGHVLMVSGASRFSRLATDGAGVPLCTMTEQGLMALCRIGKGQVRLIADADILNDHLWLVDARWPDRSEAWASDVRLLMDHWLAEPVSDAVPAAPWRVRDEAALPNAMRGALLVLLLWAGVGYFGWRLWGKGWAGMGIDGPNTESGVAASSGTVKGNHIPRTKREQTPDNGK